MRILLPFLFLTSTILYSQVTERYKDSIFPYEQILTNSTYATAPELNYPYAGEASTHLEELNFHLFGPEQDSLTNRPLLINVHGGAFLSGNKDHDDMLEFCKTFAKRGYLTATIQYRIGMNILDNNSSERAVYRGLQDSRAAIRYFRENANQYGIDTNHIYLLGSSAGAFVGLHNLYMNELSEIPPSISNSPNLGGFDSISPEIIHNSHPNGVIALWGALKDSNLVKSSDTETPLFLVHGKSDKTVNFDVAPPFGVGFLPSTYGSKSILEQLNRFGKTPKTYFVDGEDHEFYGVSNGMWNPSPNTYWDTVVTKISDFLYDCHKPTALFTFEALNQNVSFTDNSVGAINWHWDFGDSTYSILQNPEHVYQSSGKYIVVLTVQSNVSSWDTLSAIVDFGITGIENDQISAVYKLNQNYPNPFNPTTNISYSIQNSGNVSIIIYDVLGNEVTYLINEHKSAGNYSIEFNAQNLSSGIYFYTMSAGNFIESKKMVILK